VIELPDPLTPPDCDLRGLEYMPLLGIRLFGSDFNTNASDSEWRAGVTLWWAAWQQVPAASLPDDDGALCRLADLGRDLKTWKKLREGALRGWTKCADGRLYNQTLAEQALIAWDKRQTDRNERTSAAERKARERAARSQMFEQLAKVGVTPEWNIPTRDLRSLVTHHCGIQSREDSAPVTPPVTPDVTAKTGRDGTLKKEEAASCAPTREPGRPIMLEGKEIPFSDALHRTFQSANIVRPPSDDDRRRLRAWIDAGADLQVDVLDVAARIAQREDERGKTIGMLKYLDGPVH
jgi:hypothetical protein